MKTGPWGQIKVLDITSCCSGGGLINTWCSFRAAVFTLLTFPCCVLPHAEKLLRDKSFFAALLSETQWPLCGRLSRKHRLFSRLAIQALCAGPSSFYARGLARCMSPEVSCLGHMGMENYFFCSPHLSSLLLRQIILGYFYK